MKFIVAATALAVATTALTGCTRTGQCVDYVHYENTTAMAEAAGLVVVGHQRATDEVIEHNNARVTVHEVVVDSVPLGELEHTTIDVVSPPGGCYDFGVTITGGILGVEGAAEFFLEPFGGRWLTLTPTQGVEPATVGEPLPWDPSSAGE